MYVCMCVCVCVLAWMHVYEHICVTSVYGMSSSYI